ncbi:MULTISPECIES: copper resistance protein NlpE [unclassified Pseudoxanthomonas]|uniref:copper resistance protein NlpE n=1 Tax=unclassified Pseudoxanthomonas TaxID=2645906 RepID=UPI0030769566
MLKASKVITVSIVAFALVACGNNSTDKQEQTEAPKSADVAPATVEVTQASLPGAYIGTLPCGDCKGVITKLELLADGSYKLNETYDGKVGDGSILDSTGTWNADLASRRLKLDPAAQEWEDRTFEIVSAGHIRPLDAAGNPYSAEGGNDLKAGL